MRLRNRGFSAGFIVGFVVIVCLSDVSVADAQIIISPTSWSVPAGGGTLNIAVTTTAEDEPWVASAGPTVTTVAGSTAGTESFADGMGTDARFRRPNHLAADAAGNIYVADWWNHRIRKVTPAGVVTTVAGSGMVGGTDGTGAGATFYGPRGIAIDMSGTLYVAESFGHRVRKISSAGAVTTVAGNGASGYVDATGSAARFHLPSGIAVDSAGTLYVTEEGNHTVRKITSDGAVSTLAGNGTMGYRDATGIAARFLTPYGIALDAAGVAYVADSGNNRVRRVTPEGVVTTVAGSGAPGSADGNGTAAQFLGPWGLAVSADGTIYVADLGNHRIRRISAELAVTTLAGTSSGYADGVAEAAKFMEPVGLALSAGASVIVVSERDGGNRIRRVALGADWLTVSPTAGTGSGSVTITAGASESPAPRMATLTIAGRPLTVTQDAAVSAMSVSPSVLDFGSMLTGSDPADRTLTVTNSGDTTLSGWEWSFGGLGNPVGGTCGSAAANPTGLYSLTPGQNCTFVLRFTPSSFGQQGGALSVGMKSGPDSEFDVAWSGSWTAVVNAPPTTGTISGTVTDAGTGAPLAGVSIQIHNIGGSYVTSATTDSAGAYAVAALAAGTYYARSSNAQGYVDTVYRNQPLLSTPLTSGTPISVSVGSTTTGVSFALTLGGAIAGTVTDGATGEPLTSLGVCVQTTSAGSTNVQTDATGAFTVTGLPPGTYYPKTCGAALRGYVDELFSDVPCSGGSCPSPTTGTGVVVVSGTTTSNVNFALAVGGTITGVVTDALTGTPLTNTRVRVYDSTGSEAGLYATTDAQGAYAKSGLTTGTYYVRTSDSLVYLDELYNDVLCRSCSVTSGTVIAVTAGETTKDIDFALALGGTIAGAVTDAATGASLASVTVYVYNASNASQGSATTDVSGVYTKTGLPAGTYYARTSNTLGYVDELYSNLPCPGGACSPYTAGAGVAVTAGATTNGIDFALAVGGTISGTVTNAAAGTPLADVMVYTYSSTGTSLGSVKTDASGAYRKSGLATGTYYLRTSNTLGYVDELHNEQPCPWNACRVTEGVGVAVAAGVETSGVDFGLAAGGVVAGTVTAAGSGAPLPGVRVTVYIVDPGRGYWGTSSTTDASGVYAKAGLPTGTYYVRTSNSLGYIDELHSELPCPDGACSPYTNGTGVAVTAGATTNGIDFGLATGGSVTGTVTVAGTETPLAGVTVQVYNAAGTSVGSVTTNASGGYVKSGLPTGTYYARTSNSLGYVDEIYGELPCVGGSCPSVTTGTGVSVTAGETTGSVDFALGLGGSISGTVTDAGTGSPLSNVTVYFFDAGGAAEGSVTTDGSGNYSKNLLPAGTHYVVTSNSLGYIDELYDNLPCSGCVVTAGTGIAVAGGMATGSVNFGLVKAVSVAGMTVSPGVLDFGAMPAGSSPVDRALTVTNTGTVTLSGWYWTLNTALVGGTCGSVAANPSGLYSLTPGQSCTFVLRFTPDSLGHRSAPLWIGMRSPSAPTGEPDVTWNGSWTAFVDVPPGGGDFTGDRKADILWRHDMQGDIWLWEMNGDARTAETYVRTIGDTNWEIRGQGDQTGDGKADLLWRNKVTGELYLWPMDGAAPLGEIYVTTVDPAYDIVGTGDFDGDGKSDILWRHTTLGDIWIWLMDGATPLSQVYVDRVDPGYVVKGVGDLDADLKADIVWYHATTGEVWVWPMNGTTRLEQVWVGSVPDTGYQIAGLGDFDGNGTADMVWHHATLGEVWIWPMNGAARLSETYVDTVPDTAYRIVGTGDYDGNGKADLLWHHATLGEVWVWLMDGPVKVSETWVATVPDTGYRIVR